MSNVNPTWVPKWFPDKVSIDYISGGLTALLLILAASYIVLHFAKGGTVTRAAAIAAGAD